MLKKKLNNKKGFTLAELLIAVAIIGILVAISVPVFTSKLSDAREATDEANIRAAKAAAVAKYFDEESGTFYYDAKAGMLVKTTENKPSGYGQSSKVLEGAEGQPKGQILQAEIKADGTVKLSWVAGAAS